MCVCTYIPPSIGSGLLTGSRVFIPVFALASGRHLVTARGTTAEGQTVALGETTVIIPGSIIMVYCVHFLAFLFFLCQN